MAGSPCPVEVMKRVVNEMHMSEVAIAYGMTETSPVSTMTRTDDDLARRTETVGRTMPHLESKVVDPATGLTVPRGTPGEPVHPRPHGDARLLGAARADRRGDRRGPLDAHRRPRGDGRRRLPEHRRPHQGPGDPRRRERLPARGRGVPLHPPRRRRRPGDRGARRAVRRGA
nr:AMP-binding protein [Angustibacter aerolatus]